MEYLIIIIFLLACLILLATASFRLWHRDRNKIKQLSTDLSTLRKIKTQITMQNDELIEELESLKRTLQNSVEALKNRDRKITFLNKEIDELKKYPESLKENINTIEDKQISLVNLEITRPIKKKLPYEISGRKIMTVKQLAKKLDIVEDTVYVWVKNNKLPCEKSKNGRLKFIKDNINDWLMKINKGEYSVRKTI